MDWNWFYSAVAQSSAAIVGIFGAFVFTKILNNQGHFSQRRTSIRTLLQDARRLKDEAEIRYFTWYNKQSNEVLLKGMEDALVLEEELQTPAYYFHNHGFSQYQPREEVIGAIEGLVEAEKKRRSMPPRDTSARHEDLLGGMYTRPALPLLDPSMMVHAAEERRAELEKIDSLAVAVRAHCRNISAFVVESRSHPESSSLITVSVVFSLLLFYVGVIYPLAWLPAVTGGGEAPGDTFSVARLIILISVVALFTAVMVLFLVLNLRMCVRENELTDLERFGRESEYSEYLGYEADNVHRSRDVV